MIMIIGDILEYDPKKDCPPIIRKAIGTILVKVVALTPNGCFVERDTKRFPELDNYHKTPQDPFFIKEYDKHWKLVNKKKWSERGD